MQRVGSVYPTEVDEQPNGQIQHADGVLVVNGRIAIRLAHDHVSRDLYVSVQDLVVGFAPGAQPGEDFGSFDGPVDGQPVDRNQRVAHVDTGLLTGASGDHVNRHGTFAIPGGAVRRVLGRGGRAGRSLTRTGWSVHPGLIHPRNAIVGQVEFPLLLEVDARGNHRRQRHRYQHGAHELLLKLPHRPWQRH